MIDLLQTLFLPLCSKCWGLVANSNVLGVGSMLKWVNQITAGSGEGCGTWEGPASSEGTRYKCFNILSSAVQMHWSYLAQELDWDLHVSKIVFNSIWPRYLASSLRVMNMVAKWMFCQKCLLLYSFCLDIPGSQGQLFVWILFSWQYSRDRSFQDVLFIMTHSSAITVVMF